MLRLAVHRDGSFVVTIPKRISEVKAEEFIRKKADWILEKIEYFKKHPQRQIVKHSKEEIQEYKKQAGEYARLKLEHYNQFYNFSYKKITIKNLTSRWGSCSTKGNLNFSYKIILLPQELADYIIVHELCHLGQMNHSKKFWNLVEKMIPNHKELRKKLKAIHL